MGAKPLNPTKSCPEPLFPKLGNCSLNFAQIPSVLSERNRAPAAKWVLFMAGSLGSVHTGFAVGCAFSNNSSNYGPDLRELLSQV